MEELLEFLSYFKNVEEVYLSISYAKGRQFMQLTSALLPMVKILHIHTPQLKTSGDSLLRPFIFPRLEILDLSMVKEIPHKSLANLDTMTSLHTVIVHCQLEDYDQSLPFKVIKHPGRQSAQNQMVRS
jgi:hypothetical protein